jgi:hypothetical protein
MDANVYLRTPANPAPGNHEFGVRPNRGISHRKHMLNHDTFNDTIKLKEFVRRGWIDVVGKADLFLQRRQFVRALHIETRDFMHGTCKPMLTTCGCSNKAGGLAVFRNDFGRAKFQLLKCGPERCDCSLSSALQQAACP